MKEKALFLESSRKTQKTHILLLGRFPDWNDLLLRDAPFQQQLPESKDCFGFKPKVEWTRNVAMFAHVEI